MHRALALGLRAISRNDSQLCLVLAQRPECTAACARAFACIPHVCCAPNALLVQGSPVEPQWQQDSVQRQQGTRGRGMASEPPQVQLAKDASNRFDLVSRVLFPAPETSYGIDDFPDELIWVPKSLNPQTSTPEDCIPCLFLISPSARFLVFYLHSNAEDLGRCYPFCSLLRYQFQVHVLAVEYPGYGICPGGQADEESVTENAFVAFRFIREVLCWPLDGILILGRSVGTGPALAIAVEHEVYGVILISPFLSIQEICRDVIGPLAYFITDRFPNKERVQRLRSPLLLVHGKKDIVVPLTHGERLYELCRTRKRLVCPDQMEHNTNLHADAAFFVLPMLQFFALPDYCFDEIRVPHWAYDKRLSTHFKGDSTPVEVSPGVCCSAEHSFGLSLANELRTGGNGKHGAMFSLVRTQEPNAPLPGASPQLVMSPYNTPEPAMRPVMSAAAHARYPGKPGPSVVIKPPSLQEVMRIRLQKEGRSSEDAVECFGDMTDVVTVSTKTVEEAASLAVSKFLSVNGTHDIEFLNAPTMKEDQISDLLGPDAAPDSYKSQPKREKAKEEENDLPEPASEGSFIKVPLSKRGGPHLSMRDQKIPQAVSEPVLDDHTTMEDWNQQQSDGLELEQLFSR